MRRHTRRRPRGGGQRRGAGRQLRAPSRQLPDLAGDRSPGALALLVAEPAGTLAPSVAGVVELRATLAWRDPEDIPRLPALIPPPETAARYYLAETEDPTTATRRLAGEIRALTGAGLGAGLEALLREITAFAALTEATLEVGAARTVPPRAARTRALERLARDLWEAGFSVRFAPSWTPSAAADVYLGVGGSEDLPEFLRSHPSWNPA